MISTTKIISPSSISSIVAGSSFVETTRLKPPYLEPATSVVVDSASNVYVLIINDIINSNTPT